MASVEFSAVALLRIAKHCFHDQASVVSGCLLGLDDDTGRVEVTNVFLHPSRGAADFQPQQEEGAADAAGEYQSECLKLLKAAGLDANIVGWFQSSSLSSFATEATVEIQFDFQTQNGNSVLVIADPADGIRAFRLSAAYMRFQKTMRDRRAQGPATLITGGPVAFNTATESVFEEVAITANLSVLDEAYLFENRKTACASPKPVPMTTAVQQLAETVEDLALEKVRFAQLSQNFKVTGATRIRGEDEAKRMQSASDLILLTENAKRLVTHNAQRMRQ